MNRYTIYCTEAQTKKARELGAPVEVKTIEEAPKEWQGKAYFTGMATCAKLPTAEQMIGWLRTKGFAFNIAEYNDHLNDHIFWRVANNQDKEWYKCDENTKDLKEATLAAIDAALEYLTNNNMERKSLNKNEIALIKHAIKEAMYECRSINDFDDFVKEVYHTAINNIIPNNIPIGTSVVIHINETERKGNNDLPYLKENYNGKKGKVIKIMKLSNQAEPYVVMLYNGMNSTFRADELEIIDNYGKQLQLSNRTNHI